MRYTSAGTPVASFSVATREQWTNKGGEKEEKTEWHKIVAWARLGEICGEYLHKGKQVYIEGRLQTRSYEDTNGVKKYITEVVAEEMTMLGKKGEGGGEAASTEETSQPDIPEAPVEDDLPPQNRPGRIQIKGREGRLPIFNILYFKSV